MSADDDLPLPLAEAVIYLLAFLELSDDDTIDPDSAVTAMESAAADLQRLSRAQQQALAAHAELLAAQEESRPGLAEFLRGFGEGFGILEER